MKKQTKRKVLIILFIIIIASAIALMVWNLISAYYSQCGFGSNWYTAIAGWISGIATASLGLIAVMQNISINNQNEKKEKAIDVSVESIKIVNHSIPDNALGRICTAKDEEFCIERFYIMLYNYFDKPIFDVKVSKYVYNGKDYIFNQLQPIQKDCHGKSFLIKNDFMYLTANLPYNSNIGNYCITLEIKNMHSEVFSKELVATVFTDAQGKGCFLNSQTKAKLVKENKTNG